MTGYLIEGIKGNVRNKMKKIIKLFDMNEMGREELNKYINYYFALI